MQKKGVAVPPVLSADRTAHPRRQTMSVDKAIMYTDQKGLGNALEYLQDTAPAYDLRLASPAECLRIEKKPEDHLVRIHCLSCGAEFETDSRYRFIECPECGCRIEQRSCPDVDQPALCLPSMIPDIEEDGRFMALTVADYNVRTEAIRMQLCLGKLELVSSVLKDTLLDMIRKDDSRVWKRDRVIPSLNHVVSIVADSSRVWAHLPDRTEGTRKDLNMRTLQEEYLDDQPVFWPEVLGDRKLLETLRRHHYPVDDGPMTLLSFLFDKADKKYNTFFRFTKKQDAYDKAQDGILPTLQRHILSEETVRQILKEKESLPAEQRKCMSMRCFNDEDGTAVFVYIPHDGSDFQILHGLNAQSSCVAQAPLFSDGSVLKKVVSPRGVFVGHPAVPDFDAEAVRQTLQESAAAGLHLQELPDAALRTMLVGNHITIPYLYTLSALPELIRLGWIASSLDAFWHALDVLNRGTDSPTPAEVMDMKKDMMSLMEPDKRNLVPLGQHPENLPAALSLMSDLFAFQTSDDLYDLLLMISTMDSVPQAAFRTALNDLYRTARIRGTSLPLMSASDLSSYIKAQFEEDEECWVAPGFLLTSCLQSLTELIRMDLDVSNKTFHLPSDATSLVGSTHFMNWLHKSCRSFYPLWLDLPAEYAGRLFIEPFFDPRLLTAALIQLGFNADQPKMTQEGMLEMKAHEWDANGSLSSFETAASSLSHGAGLRILDGHDLLGVALVNTGSAIRAGGEIQFLQLRNHASLSEVCEGLEAYASRHALTVSMHACILEPLSASAS